MGFVLIQCPSRMLSDCAINAAASSGAYIYGITHCKEEKGWGGVRRPCLMLIQLDHSPFHLSDPTHHLCDLLLLKGEDLEVFTTTTTAFLPQHCMSSITNAMYHVPCTYHVHKIFS